MSKILKYNGENIENLVENGVNLVELGADWCGPCKIFESILEELSEEIDYTIIKVDVDEYPEVAKKYKLRSVPILLIFKNGEKVEEIRGVVEKKEILKKLKNIL